MGEEPQVHRGLVGLGVHTHRGGVDDDGSIGVKFQIVVVVLPGPGDHHHLTGPQLVQHVLHSQTGSAGTQHQALAAQDADAALPDHALKAGGIGVVAQQGAVGLTDHRVHTADGPGGLGEIIAHGDDRRLIGDGHIQTAEIPRPQEVPQLILGHLEKFVRIVAEKGVEFRRIAVAQLLTQ